MKNSQVIRLVYAHHGVSPFDRLFLELFASEFETYLVTYGVPGRAYGRDSRTGVGGVRTVKLRDFGNPIKNVRINDLRTAIATPWRILQLRRCMGSIKPDVTIASYATTYGFYASVCGCRPLILLCWGSDVLVDQNKSFLHRNAVTMAVRAASLIVVDGLNMRSALLSMGVPKEHIIMFPWINERLFNEISADRDLRMRLNWQDKVVVVSVRMHEPVYAVETLIRAIPQVVSQNRNVRFLIFGHGSLTAELVRLTNELGIDSFVHFAGLAPRQNLLAYMKDCNIYVSTSLSDSTSSSLLEAMFLGLPVIVTSILGNTEWITNDVNGLMFEKQDSDALAKAIIRLVSNPAEAERLARSARRLVKERVDWKRSSEELIKRISSEAHVHR